MTDQADQPTCTAARPTNTMEGIVQVRCERPASHDGGHQGRSGAWPVQWTTEQAAR